MGKDLLVQVTDAVHEVDRWDAECRIREGALLEAQTQLASAKKALAAVVGSANGNGARSPQLSFANGHRTIQAPDEEARNDDADGDSSKVDRLWSMLKAEPTLDYGAAATAIYGSNDRAAKNRVGALLSQLRKKERIKNHGTGIWLALDKNGSPVSPVPRKV